MRTLKATGITVAIALMAGSVAALAQMNGATPAGSLAGANVVDARGNLHVPQNYRTLYQALGSWAIAADGGSGSKEIHEVYASPGMIDAYRKTGRFPEGAILVKEVFGTSTGSMTTGGVVRPGVARGGAARGAVPRAGVASPLHPSRQP